MVLLKYWKIEGRTFGRGLKGVSERRGDDCTFE